VRWSDPCRRYWVHTRRSRSAIVGLMCGWLRRRAPLSWTRCAMAEGAGATGAALMHEQPRGQAPLLQA
jgi:hypothetical protein